MSGSKSLIFFGTEDFSAASLIELIDTGWKIKAVVTKPDSPAGRGRMISVPAVKRIAEQHFIKVLQPQKSGDITSLLANLKPEWGVLSAYGKIIPQATLDLFAGGIINIHPSLLPKYRGPSPIESVILNGDSKTGVTIMKLTAGMDEGPVYAEKSISLTGQETSVKLYARLADEGSKLLIENLEDILSGKLQPVEQDDSAVSYSQLIKKEDGVLDFAKPAEILERQVRAYASWPRSSAEVFGQKIIVTKSRLAKNQSDGALVIKCRPGYFEIEELIAPSGRKMSGNDFIRGYKKN